jgi:glycerol-3-phosphate dehydrogenase
VAQVAGSVFRAGLPAACVRLVKGSHVVVRRLYDHDSCYIFQNGDGRVFFLIPYERDFTCSVRPTRTLSAIQPTCGPVRPKSPTFARRQVPISANP